MTSGVFKIHSHRFAEYNMKINPLFSDIFMRQNLYFKVKGGSKELIMYYFAELTGYRCQNCMTTMITD
jgi:hypothetical protein